MNLTGEYALKTRQECVTVYQCPKCERHSQSEDNIKKHVMLEHLLPDAERKVNHFGTNANFSDEQVAKDFVSLYSYKLNSGSFTDEYYSVTLQWTGAGRYIERWEKKEHGYYDAVTEHIVRFERFPF